ncbi:MAG: sn-glycerol 3-phosphate transport system permease protein [Acidimicrobiaceae bacterium]|nr:sn-glycerol 3-phosphate transport system permease protein [Acidimicrobiaceae bacterium]
MTTAPDSLLSRSRLRERLLAAGFLAPSFLLFAVFVFYPLTRTAWLGLHQQDAFGGNEVYVGFRQYTDVLKSNELHHSLWITLQFVLIIVPAGLVLGTALAVLAHKPLKAVGVFRTIFSSTIATSVAVASLMWLVLLNPSIGVLANALPIHVLKNPGLLNSPSWALLAVSASSVWENLGFTFVVITAGLQSIPEELQESALVDGAGSWRRFVGVTLPLLSPTLLLASVVLTIGALQTFGQIDLLTKGGPALHTNVIVYSIFGDASPISGNDGVQAATSIVLFLVILVLSLVQVRFLDRRVHYEVLGDGGRR